MSDLNEHREVILFMSILFNQREINQTSINSLIKAKFGAFSIYTHSYFPMKDYYEKEMGSPLMRYFLFFENKISPTQLIDIKLACDQLEKDVFKQDENITNRVVNLDPGYISASQVILSTGKPYNHRVYLDKGVYAELTYRFEANSFATLPWTYPDYSHPEVIKVFNIFRELNFL